jgi:hypothetical protein
MLRPILAGFFAIALAAPAAAQQVDLRIENGRVSLDANGATPRQILDAWARVGGTKVVNGERIPGSALTLKLDNVPERDALEIILRSAAGYVAAPRSAAAVPGASMYDRILVLPTSTAPAATAASGRQPAMPRNMPARPTDDQDNPPVEEPAEVDPGAVFTFPQPANTPANFGTGPFGQPAQPGAFFGQPQQPPPAAQPGNPFAPVQPAAPTPFGTPVQPGQFGTPVQPGPFGTPMQPGANQPYVVPNQVPGQPPVFTFIPTEVPQPQSGTTVIGSPTPGVVQQPNQPGQQRPPRR